jgi:hypothetical protein
MSQKLAHSKNGSRRLTSSSTPTDLGFVIDRPSLASEAATTRSTYLYAADQHEERYKAHTASDSFDVQLASIDPFFLSNNTS